MSTEVKPVQRRRRKGEGSVFRRGDGRYAGSIGVTDPVTGAYERHQFTHLTEKGVWAQIDDVRDRVRAGESARDGKQPLIEWADRWLNVIVEPSGQRAQTKTLTRSVINSHLRESTLGKTPLSRIRPSHVSEWLLTILQEKGLSPATANRYLRVLSVCFAAAVKDGLLRKNPVRDVPKPKIPRKDKRFPSPEEFGRFLGAAHGTELQDLWYLIAASGFRIGEALGLQWSNLDWDGCSIRVSGSLERASQGQPPQKGEGKSEGSMRRVDMPPKLMDMFRARKDDASATRIVSGDDLVFTTSRGTPMDYSNVRRSFLRVSADAELPPDITMHSYRHAAATYMLTSGTDFKTVQEVLGHATPAVTLLFYAHATQKSRSGSAAVMGGAMEVYWDGKPAGETDAAPPVTNVVSLDARRAAGRRSGTA